MEDSKERNMGVITWPRFHGRWWLQSTIKSRSIVARSGGGSCGPTTSSRQEACTEARVRLQERTGAPTDGDFAQNVSNRRDKLHVLVDFFTNTRSNRYTRNQQKRNTEMRATDKHHRILPTPLTPVSDPSLHSGLREWTFPTKGWELSPGPMTAKHAEVTILLPRQLFGMRYKLNGLKFVSLFHHRSTGWHE